MEEQIIGILREQETGASTTDVCRKHGISGTTFYKWKAKYGGLDVSEARRLKSLEDENARLKKLLAGRYRAKLMAPQPIKANRVIRYISRISRALRGNKFLALRHILVGVELCRVQRSGDTAIRLQHRHG